MSIHLVLLLINNFNFSPQKGQENSLLSKDRSRIWQIKFLELKLEKPGIAQLLHHTHFFCFIQQSPIHHSFTSIWSFHLLDVCSNSTCNNAEDCFTWKYGLELGFSCLDRFMGIDSISKRKEINYSSFTVLKFVKSADPNHSNSSVEKLQIHCSHISFKTRILQPYRFCGNRVPCSTRQYGNDDVC